MNKVLGWIVVGIMGVTCVAASLGVMLGVFEGTAQAVTTCTWTGASATSSYFSDSANWSGCGGAPTSGDALVFPTTTHIRQPVDNLGTFAFYSASITGLVAGSTPYDITASGASVVYLTAPAPQLALSLSGATSAKWGIQTTPLLSSGTNFEIAAASGDTLTLTSTVRLGTGFADTITFGDGTNTGNVADNSVNTYTEPTAVSGGTLALGATNAVPSGSALSIASGATFDMAGYSDTVGGLSGAGTVDNSSATSATLTVGGCYQLPGR